MTFDAALAERIRRQIGQHPALTEKAMFGGLAFLFGGNMAVGVVGDELIVRVGKEGHDDALMRPGARTMDFTTRPMRGWITVAPDGVASDDLLQVWVDQGVAFAEGLPER